MLSINTNLSSLIAQRSLKISSNKLNTAIERMSTGFKINHSSDNAANFNISTNLTTKIGSLDIAEDNTMMSLDLITTASDNLALIQERVQRLRDLQEQASNGTYGEQSLLAINEECNSLVDEINRLYLTTEYNGINLYLKTTTNAGGTAEILQEVYADQATSFEDLGITSSSFSVYDKNNTILATYDIEGEDTIDDFFATLETHGFNPSISAGKISLKSTNGNYIAGNLADELGITTELASYVTSTSQTSSAPVTYNSVSSSTTEQNITVTTTSSTTQTQTINVTTTTEHTSTETVTVTTTTETTSTQTQIIETSTVSTTSTANGFIEKITHKSTATLTALSGVNTTSTLTGTYSISTTAELQKLSTMTNKGLVSSSAVFVLAKDLNMSGITFTPIGSTVAFSGTLDGNGYEISNITYTGYTADEVSYRNIGLIGKCTGNITNLGIKNARFVDTTEYSLFSNVIYAGGMVGNLENGSISNCYVINSRVRIEDTDVTDDNYHQNVSMGGLVGETNGICNISNTYVKDTDVIGYGYCVDGAGVIGLLCGTVNMTKTSIDNVYVLAKGFDSAFGDGDAYAFVNLAGGAKLLANSCYGVEVLLYNKSGKLTSEYCFKEGLCDSTDSNCYIITASNNYGVKKTYSSPDWDGTQYTYALEKPLQKVESSIITTTTIYTTTTSEETRTNTVFVTTTSEQVTTQTLWTTTTSSETRTTTTYTTTTETATGNSTFADLGMKSGLNIGIIIDGNKTNINIGKDESINDLVATLQAKGLNASFSGNKLTINGTGDSYVSSSSLVNLFKLGTLNKTTGNRNVNTKSDAQIYTKNLLDELGDIYAPGSFTLQVGINSDSNSQIGITTAFSLVGYNDFRGIGVDGNNYLDQLDATLEILNNRQVELGSAQNRLLSALEEITITRENLISSRSTFRDADIADVSSSYIQQQILQQASATLLSTANQSASIALSLI